MKNQVAGSPPSGSPGTSGFSLFGWVEQEADLSEPASRVLTQGPQGRDTEELASGLGRLCRQSGLWRSRRAQGPAWRGWLWGRLELQTIFRLLFDLRDKDAPGYKPLFSGERLKWPLQVTIAHQQLKPFRASSFAPRDQSWGQKMDWKHHHQPHMQTLSGEMISILFASCRAS